MTIQRIVVSIYDLIQCLLQKLLSTFIVNGFSSLLYLGIRVYLNKILYEKFIFISERNLSLSARVASENRLIIASSISQNTAEHILAFKYLFILDEIVL